MVIKIGSFPALIKLEQRTKEETGEQLEAKKKKEFKI